MSKRWKYKPEGPQGVYTGGVAVCIPWTNDYFTHATVSFPSLLQQEPDELIICNIGEPMLKHIQEWFNRLSIGFPKTTFHFQGHPSSYWGEAYNECFEIAESKYLILQHPNIVHLCHNIVSMVAGTADPYGGCVTVPNIVEASLLEAASLPPLGIGNYRLVRGLPAEQEAWSHNDVFDHFPLTFECMCLSRELFHQLKGFKTNTIFSCASDEMTMSLFAHGVKIRGGVTSVLKTRMI